MPLSTVSLMSSRTGATSLSAEGGRSFDRVAFLPTSTSGLNNDWIVFCSTAPPE